MGPCKNKQSEHTHLNYYDLLRDDTYYKPALIRCTKDQKHYESKVGKDLSVKHYLLMVVPHFPALINDYKKNLVDGRLN